MSSRWNGNKMRFKIGEKYTIQFLDHCIGEGGVLCEVTIWITKEDKRCVRGTWWRVIGESQETEEDNRQMVTIIKSAITKKRKL